MKAIVAFCFSALVLTAQPDLNSLKELKYRNIGPFRGGRVVAVAGVTSQPSVYYFGGTGGGVWKTTDGGVNWTPVSDGQFKTGSVGAIAVSESDPEHRLRGHGRACIRGNASHGDGVYKSTDAGKTWKNVGLEEHASHRRRRASIRRIPTSSTSPRSAICSDRTTSAASSDPPTAARPGRQVYTRGRKAGAVDLILDPNNPNVIYAAFWEVHRTPWHLRKRRPRQRPFQIHRRRRHLDRSFAAIPACRKASSARIGVTVSPANSDRVWALVEADDGGVFRSDNGGDTWTKVNEERNLRQRAWYYTHIFADPQNADTVYVLNTGFYRSDDGGKTLRTIRTPHGDNHDLWIAPNDPQPHDRVQRRRRQHHHQRRTHLDHARSISPPRSSIASRSTTIFRITSTARSRTTPPCASPRAATRAASPSATGTTSAAAKAAGSRPIRATRNVVYAGSYDGLITRYDHRTGQLRNINRVARQSHGLRRRSHEVSLPVELSDCCFRRTIRATLYAGGERHVQDHQRRPELGADQPAT